MSAENFQPALRRVLVHEGGYSNDKRDNGGPTMWGITWRDYDADRRRRGLPPQDVRRMTPAERDAIYRKKYWTGSRCDEMPAGVDYVLFDGAVNSGVAQSVKWLQRAIAEKDDGHVGDHTILGAEDANHAAVIRSMCNQRRRFLKLLTSFDHFGDGWMTRVAEVERSALAMVQIHPALDPDRPARRPAIDTPAAAPDTGAKASTTDIAPPVVSQSTATATTAGAATAGAAVNQIQDQLAPFSDTLTFVKYALIALAVVGVALTIYSIWKSNQIKEAT